jgi:hypothetical protein
MDVEFVNAYMERLVQEVGELTKTRLLNEARLKYMETVNARLLQQIQDLEKQVEKQNKKKAKEVNTSVEDF